MLPAIKSAVNLSQSAEKPLMPCPPQVPPQPHSPPQPKPAKPTGTCGTVNAPGTKSAKPLRPLASVTGFCGTVKAAGTNSANAILMKVSSLGCRFCGVKQNHSQSQNGSDPARRNPFGASDANIAAPPTDGLIGQRRPHVLPCCGDLLGRWLFGCARRIRRIHLPGCRVVAHWNARRE